MEQPEVLSRLERRRHAYLAAFSGEQAKAVLTDLAEYCGVGRDLFSVNARESAYFEGRRSVYLHIASILAHTTDDLMRLAGIPTPGDSE